MKKFLNILFLFIVIVLVATFSDAFEVNASNTGLRNKNGLYVWNLTDIDYAATDKLIDYLDIDTVYVGNFSTLYSYRNNLFFEFAKNKNLKSYAIYGETYEDQNKVLEKIKALTDKVYEYNQNSEYKITGLAIDSEFHTNESYKNGTHEEQIEMFERYVTMMKEAHSYANSKGLEYIACISWNYDSKLSEQLLEELIKDGCDGIQVMNYTKNKTIVNISKEIELAQKYNKRVESVAQLQKPSNIIPENATFWSDGIDACTENFKGIENAYNYDKLYFTYHQLTPMLELFKNVMDCTNTYNYKLYTTYDNESVEVKELYLVNGNEKIKSLNVYDSDNNKNVAYFYGVSYDKEYTLVVDNSTYSIENNKVKYTKNDDRIITDTREFIDYVETVIPDEPVMPDVPEVPNKPVTPDTPEKTNEPITPDTPEKTNEPITPNTPETPNVPTKPTESIGTTNAKTTISENTDDSTKPKPTELEIAGTQINKSEIAGTQINKSEIDEVETKKEETSKKEKVQNTVKNEVIEQVEQR